MEKFTITWERTVHKKGGVTLPRKILEMLGFPQFVIFEISGNKIFLKRGEGKLTKNNDDIQIENAKSRINEMSETDATIQEKN